MGTTTLKKLKIGETATVTGFDAGCAIRRRLLDLGLIRGTKIHCLSTAPGGKMSAYLIRGAVIALRTGDADTILIQS